MSIKIVLNGAGRIGKSILKQLLNDENFEIVAINEINPSIENIVYSINYDSTYGKLNDKFKVIEKSFIQNQKSKIEKKLLTKKMSKSASLTATWRPCRPTLKIKENKLKLDRTKSKPFKVDTRASKSSFAPLTALRK